MSRDAHSVLITNPGADLYGSDRMALETVRALVAGGLRVVVTLPEPGPLSELLGAAGATVVLQRTPILRKSSMSPVGLLRLGGEALRSLAGSWRLLRHTGAGTVIVNTITSPLWFPLGRIAGARVACHLHEAEASITAPMRWAMYLPLQFCHRVIANSHYTHKVLADSSRCLSSRVVVVPNTVPGPGHVVPPRSLLHGTVRLLYVGRISRRKGLDVAVAAVGLLRDRGLDTRLDIVGAVFPGNEAYESELRSLVARLNLSGMVHFHGFQQSVWKFFADCDIVVVPSVAEESFGNTAVEAALAARPAVVSAMPGLTEATAATESAQLVAPGDPEELSRAIERITKDWTHFSTTALTDSKRVAERFSPDTYGQSLMAALGLTQPGVTH